MGRGIDFKGVNLVINYDFPTSSVAYIHRIGMKYFYKPFMKISIYVCQRHHIILCWLRFPSLFRNSCQEIYL